MKSVIASLLVSLSFARANAQTSPVESDYAGPIFAGISNQGRTQDRPYVTAGDRTYLIGTQDGNFPDQGEHSPGEMAGLWLHPIKLIDGFQATVTDLTSNAEAVLTESTEFVNYPYGNRFEYGTPLPGLEVERFQFSPDGQEGIIVQYRFTNRSDRRRELDLQLSVKTDLRPVWFSDRLGIEDARDTVAWQARDKVFVARDVAHPWFVIWGAGPSTDGQPLALGTTAASRHRLLVQPNDTSSLTLVIAGSATDRNAALRTYRYLTANGARLLEQKKVHYLSVIDRARIRIPDRKLQEVYTWARINMEWLVREVPGVGRGLGAGLMEYPWWFGTETYSLQALIASGDFQLAKQTLRLLERHSMRTNGNGRIVHEVTTNGAIVNPGNSQETAQFILTVGKLVQAAADLDFAREMYPAMKSGIGWLLGQMDQDKDLFPEGYGIMEVYGLNAELIDVAVYTQQALEATARMVGILGQPREAKQYQQLASRLKARINQSYWAEDEGSYSDFYGTRSQAISATEGAIKQIELKGKDKLTPKDKASIDYYQRLGQKFASMPDSSRGWITNKNWVISTPMETGIAPPARAIRLLDKIRRENVGEYGPYLSATERQAMMTIATGVQAVSEANYGRTEQALWYLNKIAETFNRTLPGSISEMMPDYGCFTIAWTSYGIVLPLIEHIFGVQPDAINKTVVLEPHLPAGWEDMSIENLPVGSNIVSFSRARTRKGIEYTVEAKENGWTFVLKAKEFAGSKQYLNGKLIPSTPSGIRMSGRRNHILVVQ